MIAKDRATVDRQREAIFLPKRNTKSLLLLLAKSAFAVLLSFLLVPSSLAEMLSETEARGKQLYLTGNSPSGKSINALIGAESIELPASSLPCASCHGVDGRGRPEGGIVPGDITFQFLTLSYGHSHENGRKHAAFTTDAIARAITRGIDPDGNRLDSAMPRYRLSAADTADLIAYLKRLPSDFDPGLTDTTIRLGTLLPKQQPWKEMSDAMRGMMSAYFDEINAQGGIYGRKVKLEAVEYEGDAESARNTLRQALASDPVFALVAAVAGNGEEDILTLTESLGIPQIGPFTLFPEDDITRTRSTFYLLSGIANQARAMVDYASAVLNLKNAALAVIGPEGKTFSTAAEAIGTQSQKHGFAPVITLDYPQKQFEVSTLLSQIKKRSPDAIFYFGTPAELPILLKKCDQLKKRPYVFVTNSLGGPHWFKAIAAFRSKVFAAFPTLPREQKNRHEFIELIRKHGLPKHHLTAQMMAYSAADLLVEGLKRTGKALSRKKLINTLENLYQFDNSLTPLLTFNPNRHQGAVGAYVMPVNPSSDSALLGRWIEPR